MFELLAQGLANDLIVGGSSLAVGSIVTLLIKRGFELRVGNTGKTNGKYNAELCRRLHAEIDQDRQNTREDMRYIRQRLDEIMLHIKGGN